jgi:hypothetical protein
MTETRKFKCGPEAKARGYAVQQAELADRRADLIVRLTEKAAADPDGIWSDLLAEAIERQAGR